MTMTMRQLPFRHWNVEVSGRCIMAVLVGMKYLEMRARHILEESGIQGLRSDSWHPMEDLLTVYNTVLHRIGPATLKEIGKAIPRQATFPQDVGSIEQALAFIDTAYRMNHRGAGDIGAYRLVEIQPGRALMVCDSPYPCDVDLGIIEAVAEEFRPRSSAWMKVAHQGPECRTHGDRACTYVVTW